MAIDRFELVSKHNPEITKIDAYSPLSVGNGEFAFTADITGLQTFPDEYAGGIPLCTQSQWGWHNFYESHELRVLKKELFTVNGREVGYASNASGQEDLYNSLRQNPHRMNLARIGLSSITDFSFSSADVSNPRQSLNLWRGCINSSFFIKETPVSTSVCCHPKRNLLAFRIESRLLTRGMGIEIAFPYPSPDKSASDWSKNDIDRIIEVSRSDNSIQIAHVIDADKYYLTLTFPKGTSVIRDFPNKIYLQLYDDADNLELLCEFTKSENKYAAPSFEKIISSCIEYWREYWETGGIIDFSKCKDSRAYELERRVILSQYLLAIQCAGTLPPQETGLTFNSWYGKFHLEMHWWHGVHFPLWGRRGMFEKSLWWYSSILPKAKALAASQGYRGARWPKMTSYEGFDSPSPIGPFLIWQQPHPIYYAELLYRINPCQDTLDKYSEIVFESAEFMASYAAYDSQLDRYVLGPALIPMGENHKPEDTINPVFELEYWDFGLKTANEWKKRMHLEPSREWEAIRHKLSELPQKDGVYLAHENCPDTFALYNSDHPAMLGALGILSGVKTDKEVMQNTLNSVLKNWNMSELWGWDFPMIAMTAARLGRPETAVDILLLDSPKNEYLPNGHNKQAERKDLPIYLPGNGALLTALALMTAGFEGSPEGFAGFPADGCWDVEWEGINKLL